MSTFRGTKAVGGGGNVGGEKESGTNLSESLARHKLCCSKRVWEKSSCVRRKERAHKPLKGTWEEIGRHWWGRTMSSLVGTKLDSTLPCGTNINFIIQNGNVWLREFLNMYFFLHKINQCKYNDKNLENLSARKNSKGGLSFPEQQTYCGSRYTYHF